MRLRQFGQIFDKTHNRPPPADCPPPHCSAEMMETLLATPMLPTRKLSQLRKREKQDFFKKYSPLSSTNLISEVTAAGCIYNVDKLGTENSFILDPTGKQAYTWLLLVAAAVIYFYWSMCLRTAFTSLQNVWWLWVLLDTLFSSIYMADIFIQTRTSYLRDGILEQDIEKLKVFYIRSKHFKLDFLSSLPLDWIYVMMFWQFPPPLLHCVKLLKVYRVRHFITRTESRSHYPNTCRVLFLIHNLLAIIHWNACSYFLLSQWIGIGSDPWVYPSWNKTHNAEWGRFSRQYLYSFYWSTLMLTTIGELPQPNTNIEYLFMTFEYLVGILMFASLVGNIGGIIDNMQKNRTKFQNKMDNIKCYMRTTRVPENLQERVIKWFDYLWSYGHPVDEQQALDSLPDKLKAEIGIHVHFETLKKVDFFKDCEQGLLWEIVLRLRTQVYSPSEYVCRKGDVGREMYIVNSGKLEVLADENGEVLKELIHGEYFGEISVLNLGLGNSHRRRTAFVRSVGYTALLCLSQTDLLDVLNDYPKTKAMLIKKSKSKLHRDMQDESSCSSQDSQDEDKNSETDMHQAPTIMLYSDDEGYSHSATPDANDIVEEVPRLQLRTVSDQVIDLYDRLAQIEGLLKEVLLEVKSKPRKKSEHTETGRMNSIRERIRKISCQV